MKHRYWLVELRGDETQQDVADTLQAEGIECSRSRYALFEQGRRQADPELAKALADLYSVPMEFIYFGPEAMQTVNSD